MIVTMRVVNARTIPSTKGRIVGALPRWIKLVNTATDPIVNHEATWHQIFLPGSNDTAWVAAEYQSTPLCYRFDGTLTEFQKGFVFVMGWEGGIANLEGDPGGYTKYGIAQTFNPKVDVANLTLRQAEEIYLQEYWLQAGCDQLAWPVNVAHFDAAVNLGVGGATALLRQHSDLAGLLEARRSYYKSLNTFQQFGVAWLRRVDDLAEFAGGSI